MFEQLCADLPWSSASARCGGCATPRSATPRWRCAPRTATGCAAAVGWYRDNGRLHTGDPIAMAADALGAYLTDRDDRQGCAADLRHLGDGRRAEPPPARHADRRLARPCTAARDQEIRVGDIIMSRSNDVDHRRASRRRTPSHDRVDQVRNGNRWRVAAVDPDTNRVAAERLTDKARVVFDGDYLQEHITLGYAATVHSAQGVTADSCYAILGEGASRAMLYVAMTRGRHNNEAFLYQRFTNEADHEHAKPLSGDGDPPTAPRQQILGRAPLPDDPGQRRPAPHHARRSRTHRAALASRSGRRSASTPRRAPPRPPSGLDGGPPGRGAVACHARTVGRNGSRSGREHSSRCPRTGDVNRRLFDCVRLHPPPPLTNSFPN